MRTLDLPLLADENLDLRVVAALRERGLDVRTVAEENLVSAEDQQILARAHSLGRVVVTQDADFGTLAIRDRQAYLGIVYIRPGNLQPRYVLELFDSLARCATEVMPPFIVVAQRKGIESGSIRIRIRSSLESQ